MQNKDILYILLRLLLMIAALTSHFPTSGINKVLLNIGMYVITKVFQKSWRNTTFVLHDTVCISLSM